jgi:hypothetical protein
MTDALREESIEANACLAAIRPYIPDLEAKMSWLREWFIRREFAIPSRYPHAFGEALTRMKIPRQPLYALRMTDRGIEAQDTSRSAT